jgi:hypothetical protein
MLQEAGMLIIKQMFNRLISPEFIIAKKVPISSAGPIILTGQQIRKVISA